MALNSKLHSPRAPGRLKASVLLQDPPTENTNAVAVEAARTTRRAKAHGRCWGGGPPRGVRAAGRNEVAEESQGEQANRWIRLCEQTAPPARARLGVLEDVLGPPEDARCGVALDDVLGHGLSRGATCRASPALSRRDGVITRRLDDQKKRTSADRCIARGGRREEAYRMRDSTS